MTPEAIIVHRTNERLRLRIPSEKGETDYFTRLKASIMKFQKYDVIETNPFTCSLLIIQKNLECDELITYAEKNKLFSVRTPGFLLDSIATQITRPIGSLNGFLNRFTKGELDLTSMTFLTLIGVGLFQIIRGGFKPPPWYTAY